jgi:hypothetical protein
VISIARVDSGLSASISSFSKVTSLPFETSKPIRMSSVFTSRPVFSETFLLRTRAPDFLSSWWKCTSWSRTAEYAFTGTLTSPKLMEPDQIALAMQGTYRVASAAKPPIDAAATGERSGGRVPAGDELTDEVVRLYALPVDEFTAARNATAKAWKRDGRKDDAATVARLRRPSVVESALNHAAHRDPATTAAWAAAARRADDAQSATIGGADAAGLRAAVAELRVATSAMVDAAVAAAGDDSKRDDIATLLRSIPVGAAHQVEAGVLGSAPRPEDDLFAGAPTPPPRARPAEPPAPRAKATTTVAKSRVRRAPAAPPPPPPPEPSAARRELEAAVERGRAELAGLAAEREEAASVLDEATERLDAVARRHATAAEALARAEAELALERAGDPT